jgi:hypothetical protein
MFPRLFTAFNASEVLDVLERIFFDSGLDGHLDRGENNCTGFEKVGIK